MRKDFVGAIPLTYEEYKSILILLAENAINGRDPYLVSLYYDIKLRWNKGIDDVKDDDLVLIEEELKKIVEGKRMVQ